ncbi:MAG: Fic family protein [Proteobacteria bacterium]|nr:Fic family protein [Pseudomonadota bacterium]
MFDREKILKELNIDNRINMLDSKNLSNFIKESNKIEGIVDYDETSQLEEMVIFILLEKIDVPTIINLAKKIHETSYDGNNSRLPELRYKRGMNLRIGNHVPIAGGPLIAEKLEEILQKSQYVSGRMAYIVHHEFEKLHPLMDCNGRVGRAIWGHMMYKCGYNFPRSFLHEWYYQSFRYS